MTTRSSNLKKIIFYLAMFFLMTSSALVLSETMLRLSKRVGVQGLHTASEQVFNQIPGIFEPNQNFTYRKNPDLPFQVSINSLGYRGPEIDRRKPLGIIRILCLGDSTTFGEFVNDKETFPYKLQKLFELQQEPVEVINGGVGGTTIVDHLYFLRKSMEIDPDIVVLTFFVNDIPDLGNVEPLYVSFKKNRKIKSSTILGPLYELFSDTALFQLALKTRAKYKGYFDQEVQSKHGKGMEPNTLENEAVLRQRYAELLAEMHTYLQKKTVKFLFIILSSHHQIGKKTEFSNLHDLRTQWAESLAQKMGIPAVNLLKPLKESNLGKEQLFLLPYDGHHSEVAYSIAANMIYKSLNRNFPGMFAHKKRFNNY